MKEKTPEKFAKKVEKFLTEVNKDLPGAMRLELEGYFRRGVFITKKRYALIDYEGNIKTRGLEVRRRDWSKISKQTQQEVIRAVLEGKKEDAFEIVQKVILRLKKGEVETEDLIIYTQLIKDLDEYKAEGPHVAAARRAKEAGRQVEKGSVIGYIVLKGDAKGRIRDRAMPVEMYEGGYDPKYYIEKQVLPPVLRILEVFGYKELDFGDQKKLDAWF
ncbi:DNA polymerase domain-containing protein [Candidatus Undinarchaeota archaeon]